MNDATPVLANDSVQLLEKKPKSKNILPPARRRQGGIVYRFNMKTGLTEETVEVRGFRSPDDVAGLHALADRARKMGTSMLAVAEEGLAVLVCDPTKVEPEDLERWLKEAIRRSRISQSQGRKTTRHPEAAKVPEVRDPTSGRLNGRNLAEVLDISLTDMAIKVCGVTKQALGQAPTSKGVQKKLQPLEEIVDALPWFEHNVGKLRAWLQRPNRDFPKIHGKTPSPLDLILKGHGGIVARKLHNLRTGQPA
jgi:hypothetical protein